MNDECIRYALHCTAWWGFCTTLLFLHFSIMAGFSLIALYRSHGVFNSSIAITNRKLNG